MNPTTNPTPNASIKSKLAHIPPNIERWHDLKEVMQIYGISKTTVYEWMKNGLFMPPAKLGRCSRWATSWLVAHSEALKHGCVEKYIKAHINRRNDLNGKG